jgi:fatty-acyl-CoA synthase
MVENEIRQSPDVENCGVIAVPSETGEQEIHACVLWRAGNEGLTAHVALTTFLADRLPRDYIPRFIEPMSTLPITSTGKVRKVELRDRAHFGPTWDRTLEKWSDGRD